MAVTALRKPKKKGPTHHPLITPDNGHVISQSYVLSDDSCCLLEATLTLSVLTVPILPQAPDTPTVPDDDVIMDDSTPLAEEDENVEVPPRRAKWYSNSMLNLQGKLSAYNFYHMLELQTNGSGLLKLPDQMPLFFLMGLRATGVVGMSCRHNCWQANGFGDLQLSERYCNVDYVFFSSLRGIHPNLGLVDSYDIVCVWHINLWTRMLGLPEDMQLSIPCNNITFLVNKFHLAGHGKKCQAPFSFNFKHGVGRSNGKEPERLWAWLNGAGPSTKEMGPGARCDTVNDFCGFMNWMKMIGLAKLFLHLLLEAIGEAIQHGTAFRAFNENLQRESPSEVTAWDEMLSAWEADNSKLCPYESSEESMTLNEVQKMLMAEKGNGGDDAEQDMPVDRSSTPLALLVLGMDIEKSRFKIKNVTGQVANTRFQMILRRVEGKVDSAVHQYDHARGSYLSLKGHGSWENTLQVLNPGDVHGPNEKDIQDTEVLDAERLAERTGIQTGLCTYASEQAFFKRHRALAWEMVWKAAREWAKAATTTLSSSDVLDEVDLGPNADVSSLGDDFDDDDGLYAVDN
ncbi:hypothetical protein JAAARDRAFT_197155 [Jaapia argillacea MUCL 33604]|uniref:CxC2-like cysteine cluster KDZ transposase-associated domain-containing protein n=1 Tax=Jaapia argillacea MUCL 33604 TaxID=933084 RepID=A0A067PQV8_9AGAM|nr:hypothetical protein JAAARDRAFT_197155 [Jaapia argillacea MUCL 33604]